MNPRELIACAEAAMMTAKARGKNQIVLYDDADRASGRRTVPSARDVRSVAHMKMLQSLGGKLNRLNDVVQIGTSSPRSSARSSTTTTAACRSSTATT